MRSTARLDSARRADLLIEILEARSDKDANLEALLTGFREAKELTATRNLLAHNPLMLEVYANDAETEALTEHCIRSVRNDNRVLTLENLKEYTGAVEDLATSLSMAFMEVAQSSEHLWRLRRRNS